MIVDVPPYDLVVLFADQDAQKFFEVLIERGQEPKRRCMRKIRWRSLRDPRRDTVWQEPDRLLEPFLNQPEPHFLVLWDEHGSGSEQGQRAERHVVERLNQRGVSVDRVAAVVFQPEVETLFQPVWKRVKDEISAQRNQSLPQDASLLEWVRRELETGIPDIETALLNHPKELFHALTRHCRLKRNAVLFQRLGRKLSLPGLKKQDAAGRIAATLAGWFPYS